jgi:hypothetical protein
MLHHQDPCISVEHDYGLESGDGLIDELVERAPQYFAPSARRAITARSAASQERRRGAAHEGTGEA